MSTKVSIDKALEYHPFTPPRKKQKIEGSPPPTMSKPEDVMKVDIPTPDARGIALAATKEDEDAAKAAKAAKAKGGKSRRRKSKKARKVRKTRRSRK